MNNFSLGPRTSMVHQNTTQSSISYPYGMKDGSWSLILTLLLPLEHKHCILANMSYFHAKKYNLEIGCHNIKKRNWTMVWTPRYLPYMHMVKIHQQCLEHLTYWWCSGAGNNRIDMQLPKMHTLQKYLRCYSPHTRYAESQIKLVGINLTHKSSGFYHC